MPKPLLRFMIHAEWKERVPGQLLLQHRERTVERQAPNFMIAMRNAQREFPNAKLIMRTMPPVEVEAAT